MIALPRYQRAVAPQFSNYDAIPHYRVVADIDDATSTD